MLGVSAQGDLPLQGNTGNTHVLIHKGTLRPYGYNPSVRICEAGPSPRHEPVARRRGPGAARLLWPPGKPDCKSKRVIREYLR